MSKRRVAKPGGGPPEPVNPILADRLREKGFAPAAPEPAAQDAPPPAAASDVVDLSRAGKIVIARERKGRGGKTVTVVSGLPAGDLERLARALRKALGCGATVENGTVVIQGEIVAPTRAWLEAHGATKIVQGN